MEQGYIKGKCVLHVALKREHLGTVITMFSINGQAELSPWWAGFLPFLFGVAVRVLFPKQKLAIKTVLLAESTINYEAYQINGFPRRLP